MELNPEMLDPRADYCVLRDSVLRVSTVVSGTRLREGVPTGMARFELLEPVPDNYVHLRCGDFCLAVWRDPSRPELNTPEPVYQGSVRDVYASVTSEIDGLAQFSEAESLAEIKAAMEYDAAAEQELAAEIAADAERDPLREMFEAARKAARSLYPLYVHS